MEEVFEPTPGMRERHAAFVDEMVVAVWNMWEEDGQVAADPELASRMIAFVRSEWEVSSRPNWMHPMASIGVKVAWVERESEMPIDQRVDYFDAIRTSESIGERERRRWATKAMGVTMGQIAHYVEKKDRAPVSQGPTALYRHFDADDILLYVGITWDLNQRNYLHSFNSVWYPFSARCEVEWLDNRSAAFEAERNAIHDEMPLFNISQSISDPGLADLYLRTHPL